MTAATATRRDSDADPALHWSPMAEVWAEIVRDYPELRLGATTNAQYNFRQQHGAALIEADILSRGMGRTWFLHRSRFKKAFPLLIAGRPLSEVERACGIAGA